MLRLAAVMSVAAVGCHHEARPVATPVRPARAGMAVVANKPHDTEVPAAPTTVTVRAKGTGKLAMLTIAPAAGGRTPVELHFDFTPTQDGRTAATPTLIIHADAEATTVDASGTTYTLTVTSTDSHYRDGVARVPNLEAGLAGIADVTFRGHVTPAGIGDKLAIHGDAVSRQGAELMDLFQVEWFPIWPALPAESIGAGAKWQAVSAFKLAGRLDAVDTTDYEVTAHEGQTWTIHAVSKLTGQDQPLEGAAAHDITGAGTADFTLVEGALIPTVRAHRTASFAVTANGRPLTFALDMGNEIGVDVSPNPSSPGGTTK